MSYRAILLLALAVFAVGGVAACGDDDDDDDGATTAVETGTTTGTGAGGTLNIEMADFSFDPMDATAQAGSVTISAPNVGQVEHELVLFKSDADPASLPTSGNEVDEGALEEQGAEEAGEIEEVGPGQTKEATLDLTPGKYVMFCNLPSHYDQGMYGSLTVSK